MIAQPHPGRRTGTLVLALGLTMLLAAPAAAQVIQPPPQPRGVDAACPVGEVPEEFPFTDVADPTFRSEIACLAHYDITRGVTATTYEPGRAVPREQMATFYDRLLQYAARSGAIEALPAYDGDNRFSDVADGNTHVGAINRLADAGIVEGGPAGLPDDQYGPSQPVTRAQMASFVNRVQAVLTGEAFSTDAWYFPDLTGTAPHTANINAVAHERIAVGDTAGYFNPFTNVSRGQMAAFIMRHVAANVQDGVLPTPGTIDGDSAAGPALVASTPEDGATDVPVDQSVSALFDEDVDPAESSASMNGPGGTMIGGEAEAAGALVVFTPSDPLNTSTEYVVTFAVQDADASRTTATVRFTTEPPPDSDQIAPSLVASTPANGSSNVALDSPVSALFDEDLSTTGSSASVADPSSVLVSGDVEAAGALIVFTPDAPLAPSTEYVATFDVEDAAGNGATATVSFTTENGG